MPIFYGNTEVDALESIGVSYTESPRSQPPPTRSTTSMPVGAGGAEDTTSSPLRVDDASGLVSGDAYRTPARSPFVNRVLPAADFFSVSVTDDTEASAANEAYATQQLLASNLFIHHRRDNSLGFTFSGQPTDVVRFKSCIPSSATRGRDVSAFQGVFSSRGKAGEEGDAAAPEQSGPFSADIFCIILLFIDVRSPHDIIEVGRTCRFWAYYANYAPHWTYFRRREWGARRLDLPLYIRAVVAKPKIVTRDEYIAERVKVEEYRRRDRLIGTAKHLRWCVAVAIMVAAMATANFVVAYFLGFLRTALRSDVNLGITTFVLMTVMSFLEVTVVIIPLGGVSSPSNKNGMIRILAWALMLLTVSVLFGVISALAFTRVQANGHVLDGPSMDFTMHAECHLYLSEAYPSFVFLPAPLHDIRWRPLTMDPTNTILQPYCLKHKKDDKNTTRQCYNFLFFDAYYRSPVFHNATALAAAKDVGTYTAFGFFPISNKSVVQGAWCALMSWPQVVAMTTTYYAEVRRQRDVSYPSNDDWLSPARRPSALANLSYRCSSDINREKTENPPGSTDMWFKHSPAWQHNYIPLVTTLQQSRHTFKATHDHFLRYAFACYVISAILWGLLLLSQCVFKSAAIGVLGVTTAIVLIFLNPISLIIAGALCVHVNDAYLMCSASSGGSLIGGGAAFIFLLIAIYVSSSG